MHLSNSKAVRAMLGTLLMMALTGLAKAETLTPDEVKRFVASMEELKTMEPFASTDEPWWNEPQQGTTPETAPVSSAVEFMEGREAYGSLVMVVNDHGFATPEAWGKTGDRVVFAMMSLEMGDLAPGMEQKMARMMAEIENNPQFSAAQKAEMKHAMGISQAIMRQTRDVPEADRKAVRQHLDTLRRAMDYSARD